MKIVVFGPDRRVGYLRGGQVIDISLAYAKYLREHDGERYPYGEAERSAPPTSRASSPPARPRSRTPRRPSIICSPARRPAMAPPESNSSTTWPTPRFTRRSRMARGSPARARISSIMPSRWRSRCAATSPAPRSRPSRPAPSNGPRGFAASGRSAATRSIPTARSSIRPGRSGSTTRARSRSSSGAKARTFARPTRAPISGRHAARRLEHPQPGRAQPRQPLRHLEKFRHRVLERLLHRRGRARPFRRRGRDLRRWRAPPAVPHDRMVYDFAEYLEYLSTDFTFYPAT